MTIQKQIKARQAVQMELRSILQIEESNMNSTVTALYRAFGKVQKDCRDILRALVSKEYLRNVEMDFDTEKLDKNEEYYIFYLNYMDRQDEDWNSLKDLLRRVKMIYPNAIWGNKWSKGGRKLSIWIPFTPEGKLKEHSNMKVIKGRTAEQASFGTDDPTYPWPEYTGTVNPACAKNTVFLGAVEAYLLPHSVLFS